MLKTVEINGYRSIKHASLELGALNVLIGSNGAGKSNFVSFFKLLNEMMAGRLQQYIGTTGRSQSVLYLGPKVTPAITAELEFTTETTTNSYRIRLGYSVNDSLVFEEEVLATDFSVNPDETRFLGSGHEETRIGDEVARGNSTALLFQNVLNRCRVFHFHDTSPTARIRQNCYINDNQRLMSDAGNLAAMLYFYRERSPVVYRRIVSAIQKVMPDFADFDLVPDRLNPSDVKLNWRKRGSEYLLGPHQISDGTLRAMAIIALFLQPESELPEVIILDEPELGLHPHALEITAGLIHAASVKVQVIVATQSIALLEQFHPSDIIVVDTGDEGSTFHRLDSERLQDWLEDYTIGELWERNVLGGGPLP